MLSFKIHLNDDNKLRYGNSFSPLQIPAEIWPSFPGTSVDIPSVWVEVPFLLLHRQVQSLQTGMVHMMMRRQVTIRNCIQLADTLITQGKVHLRQVTGKFQIQLLTCLHT